LRAKVIRAANKQLERSGAVRAETQRQGRAGEDFRSIFESGQQRKSWPPFRSKGNLICFDAPRERATKPPRRKFLHLAARAAGPFAYHVGASYATRRLVSCWRDSSGGPYPNLAYKPDADFEPIDIVIEQSILIRATEDFPADNVKEFVAWPPHLMNACFNLPIFDTAFVCTVLNLGGLGRS
jgi:hypothetical protein